MRQPIHANKLLLAVAAMLGAVTVSFQAAATRIPVSTFTVLHNFCSTYGCLDGQEPAARLVMDQNGVLYGTTTSGGKYNGGAVFDLVPNADKSAYKAHTLHRGRAGRALRFG